MFEFNKQEYLDLKEKLMLDEELSKILEMKIKRESNVKIADELNISDRTLARRINLLKKKIRRVL